MSRCIPGSIADGTNYFFFFSFCLRKGKETKPHLSLVFASSECMSIHTYTFYTLHVSNAYFPKIYVMKHTLLFYRPFFPPSRFTRFYDPLTVEMSSLLSSRGFFLSQGITGTRCARVMTIEEGVHTRFRFSVISDIWLGFIL